MNTRREISVLKHTPLISIIVPVYNTENYLERCINSILAQTYENLEIIIVDDASTDKSAELMCVLKNRDERIRCIRHKKNMGLFLWPHTCESTLKVMSTAQKGMPHKCYHGKTEASTA